MRERNLRLLPNFFDMPDYPSSQQLRTNPNPIQMKRSSAGEKAEQKWSKKLFKKSTHSKTETIELPSKYELPEINILKNPLLQMKPNQVERSSKLILNSNKNTKMLNQIIQMLREDSSTVQLSKRREAARNAFNFKRVLLTDISDNQFLDGGHVSEERKDRDGPVFQRGPKIVNPEFIKLCDKKNMSRRKIFSEERARPRPKMKKSLNFNLNQVPEQNPTLLTFYKPTKKTSQNPQVHPSFKDLAQDFRVQI